MSSSSLDDSPRVSLPSAVDWEGFQQTQAELQAEQRQQQQRQQQAKLNWVGGLAGHAKRNSLGSITTRRRSSNSNVTASTAAAGEADSEHQPQQHQNVSEPVLGHLRQHNSGSRSSTPGRRTAGQAASASLSSAQPQRVASSAPGSKRASVILTSHPTAVEPAAILSASPLTEQQRAPLSPAATVRAATASPRRSLVLAVRPPLPSACHALPSVEHLRATPLNHRSTTSAALLAPVQPSFSSSPVAPLPAAAAPLPPPTPSTRRSTMPCQSLGSMSRFWSATRRTQLEANRRSGSGRGESDSSSSSTGTAEDEEKEQRESVSTLTQPHTKSTAGAGEQQNENRTVVKTADDADYSWLPVGVALRVEQ